MYHDGEWGVKYIVQLHNSLKENLYNLKFIFIVLAIDSLSSNKIVVNRMWRMSIADIVSETSIYYFADIYWS